MAYAVLLVFGERLLGGSAGVVILVASFVVGFAWLVLARRAVGGTRVRRATVV